MKIKITFVFIFLILALGSHAQWTAIDSLQGGSFDAIHFLNADTGFAFNEYAQLRKTTDGGQSWNAVNIPFEGFIYDFDFTSANDGYAVGGAWFPFGKYYGNAIMKTSDGGQNWDSVLGTYNFGVFYSVAALSTNEFFTAGGQWVLHSDDGGITIDTVSLSNLTNETYPKVQFTNPTTGYILGITYLPQKVYVINLYRTADGGQQWQSVYNDTLISPYQDFTFDANGNGILAIGNGLIKTTADGGNSWQSVQLPDSDLGLSQLHNVGNDVYAMGYIAGDSVVSLYHSGNWGASWQNQYSMSIAAGTFIDMSFPTSDVGYFITYTKIYKNQHLVSTRNFQMADLKIYPNPARDEILVQLKDNGAALLGFYNSLGQKLKTYSSSGGSFSHINISELKTGVYILEVEQNGQRLYRKFLKE